MTIAQHEHHESMAAIARSILASAPERFALTGLSMGGYVSFEIMRQAPGRVAKLALLVLLELENKRFGVTPNPKCDGRVNIGVM